MKITVAVLMGLVAALGIALGIVTSTMEGTIAGQGTQITGLSSRVSALASQLSSASAGLSAAEAKLTGKQPDVITCTDLRQLAMNGIDSAGDMVSVGYENGGGANAVTLPSHCYNP